MPSLLSCFTTAELDINDNLVVFLASLVTAFTTGLGALPFIFVSKMHPCFLGLANALAAGMMIGASITLMIEAISTADHGSVVLGCIAGVFLLLFSKYYLEGKEEQDGWSLLMGRAKGADARRIILVFGAMLIHSFSEGVSIGISFAGSERLARLVTASLALHNIPEGLAISIVLIKEGVSVPMAAFWSIVSSLPQPLMALPAFISVSFFRTFLPGGLGFAAGAMACVCCTELVPESRKEAKNDGLVFLFIGASAGIMVWISQFGFG